MSVFELCRVYVHRDVAELIRTGSECTCAVLHRIGSPSAAATVEHQEEARVMLVRVFAALSGKVERALLCLRT